MMTLTDLQKFALGVISRHTKSDPITGKNLSTQIGLKDRVSGKEGADMRSVINALRVKGYPICATGDGYYYAQTQTELAEFITSFQGRIDAQQKACDGLKQSFKQIGINHALPTDNEVPVRKIRSGDPEVWRVTGSQGKPHEVTILHGFHQCDCEAFRFAGKKKTCKHIESVKKYQKQIAKEHQDSLPSLF